MGKVQDENTNTIYNNHIVYFLIMLSNVTPIMFMIFFPSCLLKLYIVILFQKHMFILCFNIKNRFSH
jgi:hypothetical protein